MDKKSIWKMVIQTLISILSAIGTTLGLAGLGELHGLTREAGLYAPMPPEGAESRLGISPLARRTKRRNDIPRRFAISSFVFPQKIRRELPYSLCR